MSEDNPIKWRGPVALAVFVALLIGAYLIAGSGDAPDVKKTEAPPAATPVIPAPPPPLDRSDLIAAAARAREAYATGGAPPVENAELAGRRFVMIIPFGCGGPGEDGDDAFWTYDEERATLRASVRPQSWTTDETVQEMAGALKYEAAEGFWVSRPWISTGSCPVLPQPAEAAEGQQETEAEDEADAAASESPDAEPATEPEASPRETLALVEFFAPGSRRAARRGGRPYTLTTKLQPGEIDLSRGLRLAIEGRVNALPDGQPIACRSDSPEQRPMCLISVSMSKVAITDASGQRIFAEWVD